MTDRPKPGTPAWAAYWLTQIEDAQLEPTVAIEGQTYTRVRYGEDYPDGKAKCRDCGVRLGMFHVIGCCVERCPKCAGQAITCSCHYHDGELLH